jgi:hypothetical protein
MLVFNLILTSCSKQPSSTIIGKWRVESRFSEKVEFRKDGTVTSSRGTNTETGKYTFVDKNRLKIEFNVGSSQRTNVPMIVNCEVQVHGELIDITAATVGLTATSPYAIKPVTSHLRRIQE